jgi:hypothetical protein
MKMEEKSQDFEQATQQHDPLYLLALQYLADSEWYLEFKKAVLANHGLLLSLIEKKKNAFEALSWSYWNDVKSSAGYYSPTAAPHSDIHVETPVFDVVNDDDDSDVETETIETEKDVNVRKHLRAKPDRKAERIKARKNLEGAQASPFDMWKIRDGRAIGDVRWNQLGKLINTNSFEARFLTKLKNHVVPDDPNDFLRNLMSDADITRYRAETEEEERAAA